ncbi:two-component system sensor histidine kinase NtrB [Niallia sp. 01092]|uniref:two-component system sensor histidine kinase NtrB n=1 Tax=unclassified Niallia TaxID=2837522 RepID=UPI003FCF3DBA
MIRVFSRKWSKRKKKIKETTNSTFVPEHQQLSSDNFDSEIGKMAAFFAHEIRNPLTTIIGFTQYLEQEAKSKSETNIAQYSSIIREEANRIELLIQELLTLSKSHLHYDNLTIIDVKHSIEKIVTIYSLQFENKNITILTNIASNLYISGNAGRFERLLINLIKNAGEAIEENGTIMIEAAKENKKIVLSIKDSGPGISPEQLENIFYPFYTTKEEGTGLGLPICKTIVETLQGQLEINSELNKGVHVNISIPESRHTNFDT